MTTEPKTMSRYYLYDFDSDGARYFTGTTQADSPEAALAKWRRLYGENPEQASLVPLDALNEPKPEPVSDLADMTPAETRAAIREANRGARRVYCPRCEIGHDGPCKVRRPR